MSKRYLLFGVKYDSAPSCDVYVKTYADFEGYFSVKDTYLVGIFSERPDKDFITDLQNRDDYYDMYVTEYEDNSRPLLVSSEYTPE